MTSAKGGKGPASSSFSFHVPIKPFLFATSLFLIPCTTVWSGGIVCAQTVQEAREVKGKVIDKKTGEPVFGATVMLEGTSIGMVTGAEGEFSLKLPTKGKHVVLVSFLGYKKQRIPYVDGKVTSALRIVQLETDDVAIEEVVITGKYQRNKEAFTGSATSFTGEELKKLGAQNLLQNLSVLDPSFKIAENVQFGSDPNRMPDIEVRGKSSIMGLKEEYGTDPNQPLFILDGFETDLQTVMDLNMNRVASVTLLKDASSTAIYGSKAANGVVVIETVRPQRGKLRLNYKGDFSVTMADLSGYNLMNAKEKLRFEELAGFYTDLTGSYANQLELDRLHNERKKEIARGVNTYWLSEPLRTGLSQKHNIYADGGEEHIRYGVGLSYGNVQGVMEGSARETFSGNLDLIYNAGKFQFSNKLTLNYLDTEDPSVPFSDYAQANPYYRKQNAGGGIDKYLYAPESDMLSPVVNPLWNARLNNYDVSRGFGFTNNFIVDYFISSDFRAHAKLGITKSNTIAESRLSPLHTDFDGKEDTEKGLYTYRNKDLFSYEGDLSVTYGKLLNDLHMVNLVGGFTFDNADNEANGYSATGFTEDQFGSPSFANRYPSSGKPTYTKSRTRSVSFYLNGGYAYNNRYLVDVNYRKDGASMFGSNRRFRDTWSFGLGWNLHNEQFMQEQELFQMLKVRGSVGNPGNQNFSGSQSFTTYAFNTLMNNVFGSGVLIAALGNPDLDWQETINYTIGADIVMLKNRLTFNVDFFRKETDPLLAIITTPGSLGVKTMAMNLGTQTTNGVEATLRYSPIYQPKRDMVWTLSLNMRSYTSEYNNIGKSLDALNKNNQSLPMETTRYYDGGSPTAIWAVRSAGIDPATGKEIFIKKDGSYTFDYDVSDEVELGDTQPDVEGIIGTTFYYKGFSLGCYMRYKIGGQIFNSALYNKVENIGLTEINYNQDRRALYDRWSPEHRDAKFKGISMIQKTEKSSRFIMDENVLEGQSFTVSYDFPKKMLKRMKLGSLTLQANMNDMFYWSSVKSERGIDYPFARTVSFSASATF